VPYQATAKAEGVILLSDLYLKFNLQVYLGVAVVLYDFLICTPRSPTLTSAEANDV
jgi:hypothetical protein